jgi:hypothetical protein
VSDEVVERLDRILGVLSLAFADQIGAARDRIRANPIAAATLDVAVDWTAAGALQDAVIATTEAGKSTVRAKLAELVSLGALEVRGGGPSTEYRSTGLI